MAEGLKRWVGNPSRLLSKRGTTILGLCPRYLASLRGHVAAVYQIAWSADSRLLVSGSSDSTLKVWDVKTRKLAVDLPGHADEMEEVRSKEPFHPFPSHTLNPIPSVPPLAILGLQAGWLVRRWDRYSTVSHGPGTEKWLMRLSEMSDADGDRHGKACDKSQ